MTDLIKRIRDSVIGEGRLFKTPYGDRPLIYADYVASGRSLSFIEDDIRDHVLPWYANTHTETSHTGAQTTRWREWARDTIKKSVKGREHDRVIFCGAGATSAISKVIDLLELRQHANIDSRPLIVIGPYEHHSNELCWRELDVDIAIVPFNPEGELDITALTQILITNAHRKLLIGSFSAASNVTGIQTDVQRVATLLKAHGALSFWDYAAAAPYVDINMQDKDAVFISPHKFIGGPGTPGVLIVNEQIVTRRTPTIPGGGTVSFVSPVSHRYVTDLVRREEAGTPAIVDSIRAGLVFELKENVGAKTIEALECRFISSAMASLAEHPNIEILGNIHRKRLPILSFRIFDDNTEVHYGLIVALLNDLFGIQARGGCSCAGPYAHHLLQIDSETSLGIDEDIRDGDYRARPGWVRISFNYFIDDNTFEYIVNAIKLTATYIAHLRTDYVYKSDRGLFEHKQAAPKASFESIRQQSACTLKSDDLSLVIREIEETLLNPDAIKHRAAG